MDIQGKTIVITGAAQGLGQAMAIQLAKSGAALALVDLNESKLDETAALCEQAGGQATCLTANVASEQEVINLFQDIQSQCGPLHGLINNAGITRDALLVKAKNNKVINRMSLESWQAVIDVNLTAVFLCTREAASQMIENKTPGVIINIASISKDGNVGQTNYTASKAGVAAMTVTWAKELARYNIRVGGIAPGFIATEMTQTMKAEALERVEKSIPLQKMGQPEDIAKTAQFILENDYFTGRIIGCDGGLRL
ncbi:SDR family oxidoreductase [Piscirickettsia litoralis]|uniref:3-oxoacyl-ACP reductase n=1 Tax=Piscirickettsia litoralis TaxID=1891921 RepID=A0ABX3A5B3_9GAMM|nr:SDR family oxidoreductase [Piscirickettsia litoralis]ODN42861.1 3-oxoacyl-ACP reductase [Piscirickettsia litoralis]